MYGIFELVFRIDQDIVEIGGNKIIEKIEENVINITLKRGWTISQAKRKDLVLICAISGSERC